MADLDPTGGTVALGALGIRTPNYTGTAAAAEAATAEGMRAAGDTSEAFADALDRAEMTTEHVVELEATELPGAPTSEGTRAPGDPAGAIELDVPDVSEEFEIAVVSVDARGVTTWSFSPRPEPSTGAMRGPGATRTFVIKRTATPPPAAGETADRSIFGVVGKQVIKVVSFPIGRVLGRIVDNYLQDWEATHQGYGIRPFTTADYRAAAPYFDSGNAPWQKLAEGRTLLFIHGTFSRAHGAFWKLPEDAMAALQQRYEGRVIAFDHTSISADPIENMDWFVDQVPDGLTLDVDIICHSRGGLVARALAERTDPFPGTRRIRAHRTVLVGAVNQGTILADVENWTKLVDTMSTVLNIFGIAVGDTVDLVLAFVRQIAISGYEELRGLSAMVPTGQFLRAFNVRPRGQNEYLAIASSFEPGDQALKAYFRDYVTDQIMGSPNDGMVRIDSVVGADVPGQFSTVNDQLVLDDAQGIEHAQYFGNPRVAAKLVEWLGRPWT
jgi:pimeloyl-ACP methyl ester carboxylesterase